MKKIKKILLVIYRNIIRPIEFINTRTYMKLYIFYLKKSGFKLNGNPRFIHPSVCFDGRGYELTSLGKDVVISRNVVFLNHDYSLACGYRALDLNETIESCILRNINIGKNTFIGANCTILPGVSIGENCIVGAGSVVRGKFPDNSIITGNPAVVVGDTIEWARKKIKNNVCIK